MSTKDFKACDFILTNNTALRISPAYPCGVDTKPTPVTLTVTSVTDNNVTLTNVPGNAGVVIPHNQEFYFGVSITLTATETITATSIPVTNVPGNAGITIPAGTVLAFNGNQVTTSASLTLTGTGDAIPVVSGGTSVTAGNTATFTDEILVVSDGETILDGVGDVIVAKTPPGNIAGYSAIWSQLADVYSINQANDSFDGDEIMDKNFRNIVWKTRRIVARSGSISCNGTLVKDDPGLRRIEQSVRSIKRVYFELEDPEERWSPTGVKGLEGWAFVQNFSVSRDADQHQKVSFSLNIDGEPFEYIPD
jgi:hypothetical protein